MTLKYIKISIFCLITMNIKSQENLIDFSSKKNKIEWMIINDNVMGGRSKSNFKLYDDYATFQGSISVENNGGFASIRFQKIADLNSLKKILLHIEGDGKSYQFRVKENTDDYYSFVQIFETSGKKEVIEIDLNKFYASYRGLKLDKIKFKKNKISEIRFLIANKVEENFKLKIYKIELF
tara:strand:- start:258 stop:797 length:540 start_codon:yes stop_codon:yes gene_type:complete